jgi:hypothetical protein
VKKRAISIIFAFILSTSPVLAWAEPLDDPVALPPLLITEVQTALAGSGNASKEFVELYNTTDQVIDLTAWQLWYISATAASYDEPTKRIAFPNASDGQPLLVAAKSYIVLSGNATHLADVRQGLYDATLATNGHLRLVQHADDYQSSCQLVVADSMSWGTATPPAGQASVAPAPGESLERKRLPDGTYIDGTSGADFAITTTPSPGVASQASGDGPWLDYQSVSLTDPGCSPVPPTEEPPETPPGESPPAVVETPPAEVPPGPEDSTPRIPAGNSGLKTPQISELLPNPASPQTDAEDEFIELYNPNDVPFELSGYVLEAGLTTKRKYVFPQGTTMQPHSFVAFFSGDTRISLSNTAGQVRLTDPQGAVLAESTAYGTAKDGQAWLFAGGSWQWTTKPTPNALNVVSAPAAVKKSTTTKAKKPASSTKSAATTSKQNKSETAETAAATTSTTNSRGPIHGGVLALVGGFAVLYAAYEYRRDVANKFHQFRSNRAARRALRQSAKGR